jgi:hypothetical protein
LLLASGPAGASTTTCSPSGELVPGIPAAYLCDRIDQSHLDHPIDEFASPFVHARAGTYPPSQHSNYLRLARFAIGDARFLELLALPRVAAQSQLRALQRCAALDPEPLATQCASAAELLVQGTVDALIPELLRTRADPDRSFLLDPEQPVPEVLDLVSHLAPGLALSVLRLDTTTTPTRETSFNQAVPLFVGPDGIYNTADDLPETRARLHPDLQLETSIPSVLTTYLVQSTPGIPNYATVAFVRGTFDEKTGTPQVLFGVGNEEAMLHIGCAVLDGTAQGTECLDAQGAAIDPQQVRLEGCLEVGSGGDLAAGLNAQGDCIVMNNQAGCARRGPACTSRSSPCSRICASVRRPRSSSRRT